MKLHSSASSSSTIVFGNNDTFQHFFDHFQVFTIVEVCFTIKLCLTFSETRFFVKTTHAHKTEEFHECFQSQKCWKFRKKILFNILHISKNCLLKNIPNLKYMPNQKNVCHSPPKNAQLKNFGITICQLATCYCYSLFPVSDASGSYSVSSKISH